MSENSQTIQVIIWYVRRHVRGVGIGVVIEEKGAFLILWLVNSFLIFPYEWGYLWHFCFQRLIKKVRACLFSLILSEKWRFRLYRTFLQSPFSWNFPSQLVFLEFILGSPDTMFMSFEQRSANSESFLCYHKSSPLASVLCYLPFFVHNLAALSPSPRDKWHHCYNENSKQHHWI